MWKLVLVAALAGCAADKGPHGAVEVAAGAACVTCHLATYGTTDHAARGYPTTCEGCHLSKIDWHLAAIDARDPARDVTVNALIPLYSGTSIIGLSALAETLPMPMHHGSPDVDPATLGDCSRCHPGAGTGSYFPGTFHGSLSAAPAACASCHATSVPIGFVGPSPVSPPRQPASGEMKHDAVAWAAGAPTTTALVTQDCSACHDAPPATPSWVTGRKLHSGAQLSSCLDCHASSRPTSPVTTPAKTSFDHSVDTALGDCASCHQGSAASGDWSGGRFHAAVAMSPSTCLPCHAGERPTSPMSVDPPFDFGTNARGIGHGDDQDCVGCHTGFDGWKGGRFDHAPSSVAATTCIACHTTQRPDLQPGTTPAAMATLLGFDHTSDGSGDCFGCHQDTVHGGRYASYLDPSTHALPGGDWRGGQSYPGSTLVSAGDGGLALTELSLIRGGGGLVTGMTSIRVTVTSGMLHTATGLPAAIDPGPANAPDDTVCWHCHTSTGTQVTAYANGKFHASLDGFSATPGGAVSPLAQPAGGCTQCHAQVRPAGIVERASSPLEPMDHASVAGLDCSTCHRRTDGTWDDGSFHAHAADTPADCVACHYPAMADAATADLTSGIDYAMRHRSGQITFQSCQTCHGGALANATQTPIASTLWHPGSFHASLPSQPAACAECHAVSTPSAATTSTTVYTFAMGGSATNGPQWMSHTAGAVAGRDCASCHAPDARSSGSAWNRSASFHASTPQVTSCKPCHGLGTVPGTNNNLPATAIDSSTLTTAGADTGVPPGTPAQIAHTDANVTGHDCNFCHTQVGAATAPPARGKEWAQAKLHESFVTVGLVLDGTSGRCSHCHLAEKPGPGFGFDHSAFSATSPSDCSGCHVFPGTGTRTAPNWLGASGAPPTIEVGGFTIPAPPAGSPTVQAGIPGLPHPAAGSSCTACHTTSAGGKPANGYDHLSSQGRTSCNACHEAGTDLLGTVWNGATSQATGAGDSRPFTLPSVRATRGGDSLTVTYPNHFYPSDCTLCHVVPAGNGNVTVGSAYTSAWRFQHPGENQSCVTWCQMCHTSGCNN